jgi:peroxiredoxin
MKKELLAILIMLVCNSCTNNNYKITGDIKDLKGWVYLQIQSGQLDSVYVDNGGFTFKGYLQHLDFARLYNKENLSIDICPDTKQIVVTGDIKSQKKIMVSGSPMTDKASTVLLPFVNRLMSPINNGDSTRLILKRDIYRAISENSNNIIGLTLLTMSINLLSYDDFTPKEQLDYIAILSPEMHKYPDIQNYKCDALLQERTSIGSKFIDFELLGSDGVKRKLSDFVSPGHYVLLDFWASWCGPCMLQVPKLKGIYKTFHSLGFEIVGVSLDDVKNDWISTTQRSQIKWIQLSSLKGLDCPVAKLYGIYSVPMTYLINPDGIIVMKNVDLDDLHNYLKIRLIGDK